MTSPDPPPPSAERWRDIQRILDAALDLAPELRAAYLIDACGEDAALRQEVTALLTACTHAEQADTFLGSPAAAFAAPMLADLAVHDAARRTRMGDTLATALEGRYAIERVLSQGAMATVLVARDLRHDRAVAIKVLARDLVAPSGVERFLQEIHVTARLTHPHLLPVHESGEAEGLLYYVMPYVDGETLRARLAKGALPISDAVRMLRELADALAFAHAHGVVHRDLKPENILLSGGHAVVADFGIARALAAAADTGALEMPAPAESGVVLGTPAYMSPEQAVGHAAVDHRADLYALGVIAWELLAGAHPFGARTLQAMVTGHLTETPAPLEEMRRDVPPALAALVARLLAKAPADRPRDAAEVLRALEGADSISAGRLGRRPLGVLAGGLLLLIVALVMVALRPGRGASTGEAAIAVLPFQNLSAEGPHAYFAAGLHDELLTQLSTVAGLSVRGRASVMRYAGTTKSVGTIGEELQVSALVQASVQVVGERLRLNVQLVDVASDRTLWAQRYDRTLDGAFAIQSEVAQQVVAAVGTALSSAELQGITEAPTANAEAYRFYLQGRAYFLRSGRLRQDYEAAQQLFERAVALDTAFALAHVALTEVHGLMHRLRYDPSPGRLTRAIAEAETAIRLAPALPKAHEAVGLAYSLGRGDYRRGLYEFLRAAQGLPGDARLWQKIGFVHRNQGNWDKAVAAFKRSTELDPYDADLSFHLGITEGLTRRFADAARSLDRAQTLAPDLHAAAITKGWIYARWQGQLDTLEAVLAALPEALTMGAMGEVAAHRGTLYLWKREPDRLLQVLRAARSPVFESELSFQPVALYSAWARRLAGDEPGARAAFDSARVLLDARLADLPDDWRAHAARGLALAGLGRRETALQEVRRLEQSAGNADGYFRVQLSEDRARILAQIGEAGAALDEIERLLEGPSTLTAHVLRADPVWDPIREHARFRRLVALHRSP